MKALARAFWLAVQTGFGGALLIWLLAARRGRPLILTHHQDRDPTGRDRQLGPLLDALGTNRVEVALVPARAATTLARVRPGASAPVPYAFLVALAWLLRPFARDARTVVARWLLAALRPRVVFLIDESGSGQPFVRAARALGIRSVGIQHGDFAPGNAQYDHTAGRDVVPVDVLCVWSAWFQARLFAVSRIYTSANTRVTGRLRDPVVTAPVPADGRLRVLCIMEAGVGFAGLLAPYLAALRAAPDVDVSVQAHPSTATPSRSLADSLQWCEVAVGARSSALLEAVWHRRAIVVVDPTSGPPSPAAEFAISCPSPAGLVDACRAAAHDATRREFAFARVWGDAPPSPAQAILLAAQDGRSPS